MVVVSSLSLSFFLFLWLSTYLPTCLPTYLYIYLPIYLSIYLSISLSIFLSIYLSIYLAVSLSVYLTTWLSIYLSTYLPTYLSIYLSIYLIYLSINLSIYLSIYLPIYLSTYLPIYLSTYLPIYLSTYLPTCLPTYLYIYLPIYLSIYLSISLSIFLSIYLSSCLSICLSNYLAIYLSTYLPTYLPIYLSTHLSIYLSFFLLSFFLSLLSICLSVCLSIYLSICKPENQTMLWDFFIFKVDKHQKWSNSARLPQCLNLTTSKTKQFCETSSFFKLDNIKNEAILRDFLQKWKVDCRADSLVPMPFAIFPVHLPKTIAPATKKWCQVIRSAAPVTQDHLSKPEDLRLQNVTPFRKWGPGPPHRSDEHVSCTAPAAEKASLQILFKCPTPAMVFGNAPKPSRFAHFWQGAQSLARATQNDIWTSKRVRTPRVFNILASKCASRHNGVHFFDISTSKSGPNPWCF